MSVQLEVCYPKNAPIDAIRYIVGAVATGTLASDRKAVLEAAWNVQGYAQAQLVGESHLIGASNGVQMTQNEFIAACESIIQNNSGVVGATAVDWKKLLQFLLLKVLPLVLA